MSGTPPSAPKKVLSFGADWTLFLNFWGYLNFCEIFPVLTGKVQTARRALIYSGLFWGGSDGPVVSTGPTRFFRG